MPRSPEPTVIEDADAVRAAGKIHKLLIRKGEVTEGDIMTLLGFDKRTVRRAIIVLTTAGMTEKRVSAYPIWVLRLTDSEVRRLRAESRL